MGCENSKIISGNKQLKNPTDSEQQLKKSDMQCSLEDEIVELTPKQKELLTETWKQLVENISNVGVITFMNLFETHPDVQDVFMPFKGLSVEELRHSKELRAHGLRVMGFVQKVVARLDEPEKSEQLLKELGRNHVMYGAKVDYVDLIGPQFVFAVKPSMEKYWSEEIEDAWIQLFRYMAYQMKKAMLERTCPKSPSNEEVTKESDIKLNES
ncbi:globin D, coelomic-like isoform X1 [Uloborus diversus]|uniref:globin D, coelomic-like isoform X1 n=1 Tax=Uloborus diversus TaxID=327109 RepID=UPI002409BB21|nr:globin D, coelomic-like isoform X1 [Uloborus diversus]